MVDFNAVADSKETETTPRRGMLDCIIAVDILHFRIRNTAMVFEERG